MIKCFVMNDYPDRPKTIHIHNMNLDLDSYMNMAYLHNFYSMTLNNILNEVSFKYFNPTIDIVLSEMYLLPQSNVCFYQSYNSDEGLVDDFGAILGDILNKPLYNNLFRTSDYMIFADGVSI